MPESSAESTTSPEFPSDAAPLADEAGVVELTDSASDRAQDADEAPVIDWTPDAAALERYEAMARAALLDMTAAETVSEPAGHKVEADRIVSIYFATTMTGYPGWLWTVSISHLDDSEPTVLETELTPGEGALLAPEWTPWGDRLAAQNAADELAAAGLDDSDDDDSDDDDLDDDSDDDELDDDDDESDDDDDEDDSDDDDDDASRVRPVLHSGDLDGVDIDDLDEADVDDEDDAAGDLSETAPTESAPTESAAGAVDVDEPGEAEPDPDGAGDEHPGAVGGEDRLREDQ